MILGLWVNIIQIHIIKQLCKSDQEHKFSLLKIKKYIQKLFL